MDSINIKKLKLGDEPLWFKKLSKALHGHYRRLTQYSKLCSNASRYHLPSGTASVDLVLNNLVIAENRKSFEHYRELSKPKSSSNLGLEEPLLYLGNKAFLKVPAGLKAWELQLYYYLANDIVTQRASLTNAHLCLESACRFYGVKPYICRPDIHLGWRRQYKNGNKRTQKVETPHFCDLKRHQHNYRISESDITEVNGIRVTTLLRTLLDVLAYAPEQDFMVLGDQLLRKLVPVDRYSRTFDERKMYLVQTEISERLKQERPPYPISKVNRRFEFLSPLAESPAESLLRYMFYAAGFTPPQVQKRITFVEESDGHVSIVNPYKNTYLYSNNIFIDMAWPELGLAVEFDGRDKYLADPNLNQEKTREEVIACEYQYLRRFRSNVFSDWTKFRDPLLVIINNL